MNKYQQYNQPMKRRLPPLNALVAFESAARHKSFKNAGNELCVTASAISHQVRLLEDWLGGKLFERSTRAVELTDFGARYRQAVGLLLDQLEKISGNEVACRKKVITIQTTDSFAARWLVPRLSEFESLHPDIAVRIVTYDFREGLRSSEADLGILFVTDKKHNAASNRNDTRLLFREEIFPVCSPRLITDAVHIDDLSNFTLIHDDNVGVSWQDWLSATTEIDSHTINPKTEHGPHYNHAHLALKSAELGNGLVLASNVLTSDAMEKGQLIAPFKKKIVTGHGYCVAQSENPEAEEYCRPFSEWIFSKRC